MTDSDSLLSEREKTHGDFERVADIAQAIRKAVRNGPQWGAMPAGMREALDMDATKIARIVCGDYNHPDHWDDRAGYIELARRAVRVSAPEPEAQEAKSDDDRWIEWKGGECPVHCDTFVEVRLMDGSHLCASAKGFRWSKVTGFDEDTNIIAYRVIA